MSLKDHIENMKALDGKVVEAGWFSSDKYQDGTSVPFVASINEFGAVIPIHTKKGPSVNIIPPRPFMRRAAQEFARDRKAIENRLVKRVFSGKMSPDQIPDQIGEAMKQKIMESIDSGLWEPNAESTAKAKGFNRPLVGKTGTMGQTLQSKVTKED